MPVQQEGGSGLSLDAVNTILNAPGIAKGADGAPIGGAELVTGLTPPPGLEIQDFRPCAASAPPVRKHATTSGSNPAGCFAPARRK
jgi:hypothetical protein